MQPQDDAKLDASVDEYFRRARLETALEGEAAAWDDRADATVRAAEQAGPANSAALETLLAAPLLDNEPGEPGATNTRNGTQQMSDESSSKPPPSRRPSLKDLAETVKNRPSTPAPSAVSAVRSSDGPTSSAPASRASLKDTLVALDGQLPAPPSARNDGAASAPPASVGAGPASASGGVPASAPPPSVPMIARAPLAAPSNPASVPSTQPSAGVGKAAKQGGGAGIGIAIAVIGLAAAAGFGLYMKSTPTPVAAPTVAAVETAAPAPEAVVKAPTEAEKPAEKRDDGVLDLSQLDDAKSAAPLGGPLPGGPLPASAGSAAAPVAVASAGPTPPGGPNEELGDAIRNRAGGGSQSEDAEPAAAEGSKKNLPDIPPTGAVTSAVNAVKGGAKSCVAGAEEPSSATITFGSSGAVQSVSVGGWAQGKSAAGCIKSALQAAKVPPFARPSYSTSVTIRP